MDLDLALVKDIPRHLLPDKLESIQIIEGGLNNRNFLLNSNFLLKEYLQRDEKHDPVILRYQREKVFFSNLTNFDFIPHFLNSYEDKNNYFIGRRWVEGEIYSIEAIENNPDELITTLSILHSQKYDCTGDYDYFDVINRYLREYELLSASQKWNLPDIKTINTFYDQRGKELVISNKKKHQTRIHGDLVFSNIINSNQKCVLIDWEYTTCGDSLIDIAYLITQNSIPLNHENTLISLYEEYNSLKIDLSRLSVYKDLMNLMSALWYALQSIRINNETLTHSKMTISSSKFKDLATQVFNHLKIH